MNFEFYNICALLGTISSIVAWLITSDKDLHCGWVPTLIAIILTLVSLVGCGGVLLYQIADDKVEQELYLKVHDIDCVQYVQYNHPDTNEPVICNVNEYFQRSFAPNERVKVTIYSEGPYNGVYGRPETKLTLPGAEVLANEVCPKVPPLVDGYL